MATVYGNITGLKKKTIYDLERIYRRKIPANEVISQELARFIAEISYEINRQIGIMITREGVITHVICGDASVVFLPELTDYPLGKRILRGLRFIHTHLKNEGLSKDDLTDLALLRFDYIAAIGLRNGLPDRFYTAHLLPHNSGKIYEVNEAVNLYSFDLEFKDFINSLEEEMERQRSIAKEKPGERAILVSVAVTPRYQQDESLNELEELARSCDVEVLDKVVQRPREINPRFLMGSGKIKELVIDALGKGATLLVFDQDLSPSQSRAVTDITEMKVIDRSQLILDIFARRAHSRDGKVQVELAQLKYRLPRLTGKGTAMSRLMGGIGGRGPGEMKLEIDRRRVRDRINLLEMELEKLSKARLQRKRKRLKMSLPILSIIGYTNAGKSTLLNSLTKSATFVEDKMFATLDTASRRLRFPHERDVIITDTVGFIRDLPPDLMAAFKATLEELEDADLLMHVVDASNPRFEQHMDSVGNILKELDLLEKPQLLVFNKCDAVEQDVVENLIVRYEAVAISAINNNTFGPLLQAIHDRVFIKTGDSYYEANEEAFAF
ncbi:MAG: GTPase HflX [Nitrospirae bacterium]|nr:GTPase HflX [Nitrospirota bacterium]